MTLCHPIDCNLPGSSVHGIFQARVLEWVAISFSGGSSQPGDRTQVSCIAGRLFTLWATREAHLVRSGEEVSQVWGAEDVSAPWWVQRAAGAVVYENLKSLTFEFSLSCWLLCQVQVPPRVEVLDGVSHFQRLGELTFYPLGSTSAYTSVVWLHQFPCRHYDMVCLCLPCSFPSPPP